MHVACSLTRRVGQGQEFIQVCITSCYFVLVTHTRIISTILPFGSICNFGSICFGVCQINYSFFKKSIVFVDELASKHRKKYGDNFVDLDKQLTLSLLSAFGISTVLT